MLKHFGLVVVVAALSGLAFSGSTTTAVAQDSGCYMVTTTGKVVNLRGLCGGGSTGQTSTPQRAASQSRTGVFQVPIKRRDQGIPVLEVTFNDKQTFELLMDRGAFGAEETDDVYQSWIEQRFVDAKGRDAPRVVQVLEIVRKTQQGGITHDLHRGILTLLAKFAEPATAGTAVVGFKENNVEQHRGVAAGGRRGGC